MNRSQTLIADRDGERLDLLLSRAVPDLSRSHAQRLIADGCVRVTGATPKASLRLEAGTLIELTMPEPRATTVTPEAIPLRVLYEDADVLVIDKPAGMPVHPGPGHESATVVNAVLAHCPDLPGISNSVRPGIVHRLDKDTSGLLIIAKTDAAQVGLSAQMADRAMRKEYLALVQGQPPAHGVVDAPLDRDPTERKRMAIVASGRQARTRFRVLGAVGAAALVLVRLETGRTHQIRVHFAGIGHPVIGDAVYGKASDLVDRHWLHAWRLGFRHPRSGDWLSLVAPPPEELVQALRVALARAAAPDVNEAIAALLVAAGEPEPPPQQGSAG